MLKSVKVRQEKEEYRQKFLSMIAILPSNIHISVILMQCNIVPCNYYAFLKGNFAYMSIRKCEELYEKLQDALIERV